jgi:hypothetical protein
MRGLGDRSVVILKRASLSRLCLCDVTVGFLCVACASKLRAGRYPSLPIFSPLSLCCVLQYCRSLFPFG